MLSELKDVSGISGYNNVFYTTKRHIQENLYKLKYDEIKKFIDIINDHDKCDEQLALD